jgi:ADP-heptose:LPS heptosyltransferase
MLAPAKHRAVFIRMDKIGDLVCTLPVDQIPELSGWQIDWVIARGLEPVVQSSVPARSSRSLGKTFAAGFFPLLSFLRKSKSQIVVVFQAPWWVSLACWLSRIPVRSSRLSQWHSFLFFNRSLRQSRSSAVFHEADYNLHLVQKALNIPQTGHAPILKLQALPTDLGASFATLGTQPYFIFHPGMFGSALNWSQNQYNILIEKILEQNPTSLVVVTGTAHDERFLTDIKARWNNTDSVLWAQGKWSMKQLMFALSRAKAVIAPSTGVLHLAASLGIPSLGIYSPVRTHKAQRWGPRGDRVASITPLVSCPATLRCHEHQCPHYPCMDSVTPDQVLQKVRTL